MVALFLKLFALGASVVIPLFRVTTEDARGLKEKCLPPWLAIAAVAAATAAATITTVTAAAAATTTATKTTPTAATTSAIFARLGFINGQTASIDLFAIELFDSLCSLFLAGHFNEAEAT